MLLATNNVLNSNAELAILVEAGLIRDAHTFFDLHVAATANTLGSLVHIQESADTMTSAVTIVETCLPQVLASKQVHISTADLLISRPFNRLKVNDAHQHTSIGLLLELSGCLATEVTSPRDVSGAIEVLTTRVKQVDLIIIQLHAIVCGWLIMNDGSVSTDRRDGVEAGLCEQVTLSSEFLDLACAGELVKTVVFRLKDFLEVSEVLHDSSAIAGVSSLHASDFGWSLACLQELNMTVLLDSTISEVVLDLSITLIKINTDLLLILDLLFQEVSQGIVGLDLTLQEVQVLLSFVIEMVCVSEKHHFVVLGIEHQVAEEHRVIIDIGGTHVQDPGDLIECSH